MPRNYPCQYCELTITPYKQINQEEFDALKEHMDVSDACESCLLAALGNIEFPDQ